MDKKQILILHGGGSFETHEKFLETLKLRDLDYVRTKNWRDWLIWSLEDNYEFIKPTFPNNDNSDYEVRKVWFEKYFPQLKDDLIIIGHSLGTIFIMKYLLENKFPVKIKELHLVAPIVSNTFQPADDPEHTGTFTFDYEKIKDLANFCEKIIVWHSKDDTVCDYKNAEYIKQEIPESILNTLEDRDHFLQSTFPELYDHFRNTNFG